MAGGSEFQVRGAAVLKNRLANDVRRNGTYSSGTDDDRVLSALSHTKRTSVCWQTHSSWSNPCKQALNVQQQAMVNRFFQQGTKVKNQVLSRTMRYVDFHKRHMQFLTSVPNFIGASLTRPSRFLVLKQIVPHSPYLHNFVVLFQ